MAEYRAKPRWTRVQIQFVKEHFATMTDDEIAEILGRTPKSVRLKRQRLEHPKDSGRGICRAKTIKDDDEELEP